LTFTHRGKIDAIYIDPPYNTGAKDWKYNQALRGTRRLFEEVSIERKKRPLAPLTTVSGC